MRKASNKRSIQLPTLALLPGLLLALAGCAGNPPQPPQAAQDEHADAAADTSPMPAAQAAFEQGLALLQQGRYPQAAEVLSPIAKAQPGLPGPLVNLAIAYIHLDRQQEAVAALQQALAADPQHPIALNWSAILERRAGHFQKARELYQRLLAAHPEYRYGHLNLGILCELYLQQPDCALAHYKRYQELTGEAETDEQVAVWISDLERRSGR
jgi:tetratricopeptide (TPR) repeat protein